MGLWTRIEVFPMIARIIRELHGKRGGFIHHRLIASGMLNDAIVGKLVRSVSAKRRTTTPEWEAMEMVAWFSQTYPGSSYEEEFERREDDGYAYKPRQVAAGNLFPDEVQIPENAKFIEGAMRQVTVNAYERDPQARQLCIARYGTSCTVCGFSFEANYGERFRGFIHVHHLRQLSKIGKEYLVDPIADLRPVCPNCHAALHHGNQAYSIDEVKSFLANAAHGKLRT
jgi:predicted HNH restriction endonuclease